ncbi:MAG: amidohydrolase [Dehalococcoidia bacterium]
MHTLLTNVTIHTIDPTRPRASAVAIKDGRIAAVGESASLLQARERETEVIDLGGRCLIPGFVDAHNHFGPTTLNPVAVDISPDAVADIPALQARIAEAAHATPAGGWIRAVGYADDRLTERRHPTRWELDEAAPEHPVVAVHSSYHRVVANSRALELIGIVKSHTYRPYGTIDCDPTGEPIGLLAEAATNGPQRHSMAALIERHEPQLLDLVEANGRRHLALGITALQDAWVPPMFLDLMRRAAASGRLPLYYTPLRGSDRGLFDSPAAWLDGGDFDADRPPRIRRGGIKLFADGAGVTAATRLPGHGGHDDGVDEGILFYEQARLNELVEQAARRHLTVAIHAIGNRAIAAALAGLTHARAAAPTSRSRFRIDHFFWATDAEIEQVRALEVGVVTQPVGIWQYGDRPAYHTRPKQFLNWPVAQLHAAGVPVGGSSDAPCFALPPLWGIAAAAERRTIGRQALSPEQAVSVLDAIRMYTLDSAWAGGTDDEEGSITPGKLANFVLLAEDPTIVPVQRVRDIVIDETWVDGRRVYAGPHPPAPSPAGAGEGEILAHPG